jgi:hypothetical protein
VRPSERWDQFSDFKPGIFMSIIIGVLSLLKYLTVF